MIYSLYISLCKHSFEARYRITLDSNARFCHASLPEPIKTEHTPARTTSPVESWDCLPLLFPRTRETGRYIAFEWLTVRRNTDITRRDARLALDTVDGTRCRQRQKQKTRQMHPQPTLQLPDHHPRRAKGSARSQRYGCPSVHFAEARCIACASRCGDRGEG